MASPQMALAIKLALGQGKEGDLLRLTWKAYDGQFICLRQSKTGVRVVIPVGAPLKTILDAHVECHRSSSLPGTTDPIRRMVFVLRGARRVKEPA